MEGQKSLGLNLKYLRLCSEDEQRSYRLGTTRKDDIFLLACGWVCCMCKAVELRSEVCLWVLFVGVCYALTRATAFRKSVTAQH